LELIWFIVFINVLDNETKGSCIMFADDIKLGGLVYRAGMPFRGVWDR